MQEVLVVGGAGYIGSHTVNRLLKNGYKVVVVDDLSTGAKASLPPQVEFYQVDILNISDLKRVFAAHQFSAILHFAAKLSVPESFSKYFEYFDTNVVGTKNLLKLCEEFDVKRFVFSSTAAVYGTFQSALVKETDPLNPQNPYGMTKMMAEILVKNQTAVQKDFRFKLLRYFNVAGAEPDGTNGPRNLNSGQLVMNLCKSALSDRVVRVFGTDYGTNDGTAIRDYIHVVDLADAHIEALRCLDNSGTTGVWNCGYGKGYSVMEVVKCFEKVAELKFDVRLEPRRQGDPAEVVANNELILKESQWSPKYNDISGICKSAYEWVKNGLIRT
jgi:UDP-glucose 4-epimerase